MKVHIIVAVYQGIVESAQAFLDRGAADKAEAEVKAEMGIRKGEEDKSENAVVVFHDVPVSRRQEP